MPELINRTGLSGEGFRPIKNKKAPTIESPFKIVIYTIWLALLIIWVIMPLTSHRVFLFGFAILLLALLSIMDEDFKEQIPT